MRAIVQRVLRAAVHVNGETVAAIDNGLLVLVGISRTDKPEDAEYICRKILGMRLWPDEKGKAWTKSVTAKNYEILLVSQFTLYGILKGNKPDFHNAMPPEGRDGSAEGGSRAFYASFVEKVRKSYVPDRVKEGVFGAMMEVELVNDGPVTIQLESPSSSSSASSSP
ncbi:D-aminoacyl-tRNA deacylase [Balamuthia mandrillaris]